MQLAADLCRAVTFPEQSPARPEPLRTAHRDLPRAPPGQQLPEEGLFSGEHEVHPGLSTEEGQWPPGQPVLPLVAQKAHLSRIPFWSSYWTGQGQLAMLGPDFRVMARVAEKSRQGQCPPGKKEPSRKALCNLRPLSTQE